MSCPQCWDHQYQTRGQTKCNNDKGGGAVGTVLVENDRVRVTRWDFLNPGIAPANTGMAMIMLLCRCSTVNCGLITVQKWRSGSLTTGGSYFGQPGSNMMSATAMITPAVSSRLNCLRQPSGLTMSMAVRHRMMPVVTITAASSTT